MKRTWLALLGVVMLCGATQIAFAEVDEPSFDNQKETFVEVDPNASSSSSGDVNEQILAKQEQIIQMLNELKAELQVVKVRATQG